jgi:hypothetical protein
MKFTGTYNGKPIELELTEEQVESLILNRKKTGWERVKEGETFWCAGTTDTAFEFQEVSSCRDDRLFSDANYFSDVTLAQNIIRAQELQRKLWRRSAELCEKVDWNDSTIEKFAIKYAYDAQCLYADSNQLNRNFGQIYFDTREHAEQAIKEFKDELLWYFTKFESRMD